MAGIWGIDRGGGSPMLITDRLGVFSADLSLRAFLAQGQTVVERLADGSRWIIPNGGRAVSFSRDGAQLAWTSGQSGPPFDSAQRQICISNFDGSNARKVHELLSGSVIGWYPDGRLLVSGRLSAPESGQAIWALTPPTQETETTQVKELARGQRLRATSLSPDGAWLAYVVTFSDDPAQDGLWLLNTNNLERRKLELFGSYRWRDGSRLLIVPLDLSQSASHRLWQVDAVSGQHTPLSDPEHTPFKIANGDWSVSPDGSSIAYVSAQDQNIWVINLPSP
jgi:Tol biopolymer transport system component